MNNAQLGGFARAKSLSEAQRRSIARKAAKARWNSELVTLTEIKHQVAKARWNSELVTLTEIKHQVANALIDRSARAYLFGSYARLEATSRSDVDLMVVLASSDADWFNETAIIRGRLDFGRPIDLIVIDDATYEKWKKEKGSVQYEVEKTGVQIV